MVSIDKGLLDDYNEFRAGRGLGPVGLSLSKTARTISLSDDAYEGLMGLAIEWGYTATRGRPSAKGKGLANGGSVSELLEAIGRGLLSVIVAQDG